MKATKGNYERAAAGSFKDRATTPASNDAAKVRTGKLASELPPSQSYSTLAEAEQDKPSFEKSILPRWR
jgi:hypothetical protein